MLGSENGDNSFFYLSSVRYVRLVYDIVDLSGDRELRKDECVVHRTHHGLLVVECDSHYIWRLDRSSYCYSRLGSERSIERLKYRYILRSYRRSACTDSTCRYSTRCELTEESLAVIADEESVGRYTLIDTSYETRELESRIGEIRCRYHDPIASLECILSCRCRDTSISDDSIYTAIYLIVLLYDSDITRLCGDTDIFGLCGSTIPDLFDPDSSLGELEYIATSTGM